MKVHILNYKKLFFFNVNFQTICFRDLKMKYLLLIRSSCSLVRKYFILLCQQTCLDTKQIHNINDITYMRIVAMSHDKIMV